MARMGVQILSLASELSMCSNLQLLQYTLPQGGSDLIHSFVGEVKSTTIVGCKIHICCWFLKFSILVGNIFMIVFENSWEFRALYVHYFLPNWHRPWTFTSSGAAEISSNPYVRIILAGWNSSLVISIQMPIDRSCQHELRHLDPQGVLGLRLWVRWQLGVYGRKIR